MGTRLPVLLRFDVEPDEKIIEGRTDWAGIRPPVELLETILEHLLNHPPGERLRMTTPYAAA